VIAAVNDRTLRGRASELPDPEFVRHDLVSLFPDSHGQSGASDFLGMIIGAMPDFRIEIVEVFPSGDRVTALLRMHGTHTGGPLLGRPATGRVLSAPAIFVYRVRGGRLVEGWQMVDGLAFHRLVGLL
jgi:predicted ester cyclase